MSRRRRTHTRQADAHVQTARVPPGGCGARRREAHARRAPRLGTHHSGFWRPECGCGQQFCRCPPQPWSAPRPPLRPCLPRSSLEPPRPSPRVPFTLKASHELLYPQGHVHGSAQGPVPRRAAARQPKLGGGGAGRRQDVPLAAQEVAHGAGRRGQGRRVVVGRGGCRRERRGQDAVRRAQGAADRESRRHQKGAAHGGCPARAGVCVCVRAGLLQSPHAATRERAPGGSR